MKQDILRFVPAMNALRGDNPAWTEMRDTFTAAEWELIVYSGSKAYFASDEMTYVYHLKQGVEPEVFASYCLERDAFIQRIIGLGAFKVHAIKELLNGYFGFVTWCMESGLRMWSAEVEGKAS